MVHMYPNSDSTVWVDQSRKFYPELISPLFYYILYLIIPCAVFILVISALQHGKVFRAVRICIDTAAMSSLLLSVLLLVAMNNPNPTKTAVVRDFLCYGFLQTIVLLCDNFMFYKSYAVVVKVQSWKRHLIHTYVWIILILTWLPKWTILPFFVTEGDTSYVAAFFYLDQISYYGNIVYNFYFTVQFVRVLMIITHHDSHNSSRKSTSRTVTLIMKGIGHCITSSLAALLRNLDTNQKAGFPIWIFILVVGLQLWFNSKIEILLYSIQPSILILFNRHNKIHDDKDTRSVTPPKIRQGIASKTVDKDPFKNFWGNLKPKNLFSRKFNFTRKFVSTHIGSTEGVYKSYGENTRTVE